MTPACTNCAFARKGWILVRCHRYPPQRSPLIAAGSSFMAFAAFPAVDNKDWCGEYRKGPQL